VQLEMDDEVDVDDEEADEQHKTSSPEPLAISSASPIYKTAFIFRRVKLRGRHSKLGRFGR
jgi:hypothetical protein